MCVSWYAKTAEVTVHVRSPVQVPFWRVPQLLGKAGITGREGNAGALFILKRAEDDQMRWFWLLLPPHLKRRHACPPAKLKVLLIIMTFPLMTISLTSKQFSSGFRWSYILWIMKMVAHTTSLWYQNRQILVQPVLKKCSSFKYFNFEAAVQSANLKKIGSLLFSHNNNTIIKISVAYIWTLNVILVWLS